MKDQCKQAVSQAIGRTITTQEAQNIEQLIRESMKQLAQKDIAAWRQLSDADRLTQAAAEVGKMLQAEAIRKAKIAADDILKMSRNTAMLTDPSIRNISANERLDRIVAAYGDMSGIQSIDSKARSIAGIYHGRLIDFYTGIKGGLGIIVDPKMVRAVVHEMFGNDAGVPAAKQIAKELADVLEELRLRFNRAGGNIGKLDDWGLPQSHAPEKLAKAGRDNWVNTVMPMLNRDKYVHPDGRLMDDAEVRAMLDEAFITISTNGANKLDPGRQQLGGGRGKKAVNRHAEERAIHFKDSDSWLAYQNEFGHMRLVDLIESHISGLSKDIALVETLGSNPQGAMKLLMDQAEKIDKLQNGKSDNEVTKTRGRTEIMFNELLGQNQPVNRLYANIGNAYRSINIASMLGGTTLASMADQAMMAKTASVHNIAYRKVFGELIYNLNPKNKADRELAHSLGIATQEMIGAVSRYSDDGLASVAGKAEKIAKVSNAMAGLVMRASGLNYLTASNKIAFSKMLMNKYATLSREKDWNSLHADDRALLEGSGIREQDWQIWQLAKPTEDIRGNQLMSAESIYQIPDSELLKIIDPEVKSMRDDIQRQVDELNARNQTDQSRIDQRQNNFLDLQQKASQRLQDFINNKASKNDAERLRLQDRADLLSAQMEHAAAQADINTYLQAEKQSDRIQDFLQQVEEGRSSDKVADNARSNVERNARQYNSNGERLGYRIGNAERRITEIKSRLAQNNRTAEKEIKGKADELTKRLDAANKELGEYILRSTERQTKRQHVMDRLNNSIGDREATMIKQTKDQAATNLMVHINDEQGMAVIEAGLRERTWMTGGMRKGTPMGEIVKSTMQFKSFSAAMLMRHGSRVFSQEGAMSKAYYAASLMAMTTMLGGLVVQLRAISNGDDPESMVSDDTGLEMDFFKRSFVAGGGLPVLGDIMVAGTDTTGRSLTSWMSGVPGGDAQTILGATVGNLTQLNNGTETNAANETFKMVKNKIPAQNLWYTKAVTNALLFDQFQDMIAPGYREKQKRKAEQKFDRSSWWGNGVLPERAPDFEKAIESKD